MTYEVTPLAELTFAPDNEVEEILQNVRCLMSIARGSAVLERNLGIDIDLVDAPIAAVRARLAADLAEQIALFEPRAKLRSLSFEGDAADGTLHPLATIVIGE